LAIALLAIALLAIGGQWASPRYCGEHSSRFGGALLVLGFGVAVGDDPSPGLDRGLSISSRDECPNGDRGVEVAREVDVTDDPGVRTAFGGLELVDDLHRPHLRCSRDG